MISGRLNQKQILIRKMIPAQQPSVFPMNTQPKFTQSYEALEYEALRFSNLSVPDQIASFDIPIGQNSWIHEIRCGFQNKEDIVLLHGYGGIALTFIRIFQELATRFRVHALDFLGMGLSHRQKFEDKWNHEQTVTYYVDSIEAWRISSKIKTFVLAGHSFGAYIGACYAKKYPNTISRLILISPPGVKQMDEQMSQELTNQMMANASCGRKIFFKIAKSLIDRGTTPSNLLNWPLLGCFVLNKVVEGRLKLKDQEKEIWKRYYTTISKITPNSERGFFKIFLFPKFGARDSIEMILTENKFPFKIEFYYGDNDWMESATARTLPEKLKYRNKITFTTVNDSGHQIIFENPAQMAKYILEK